MKTTGRKSIAAKIAEARGHGDLSENAEYDAAKEEQQHHELKIARLELTLSRAKIIQASDLPNDKIYILSQGETQGPQDPARTSSICCVSPKNRISKPTRSP